MSKDDALFLRGFWCIIVVLVHVPELYQNRIQDMLGSFAYIGVTFFFLTSSYGLRQKLEKQSIYKAHFWRKRLPAILVPALLSNFWIIVQALYERKQVTVGAFIGIDSWVRVLLLLYLIFWLVYIIIPKYVRPGVWQDLSLVFILILFSLLEYFTSISVTGIWIVEPLGFAYGIIIASYKSKIQKKLHREWPKYVAIFMCMSLICGIAYLKYKPYFVLGYVLKIILGVFILAFMYSLLEKFDVGNKVIYYLGNISYEIYLLHGTVFALVNMMLKKANCDSGVYIWSSLILTIIIATMQRKVYMMMKKCILKRKIRAT